MERYFVVVASAILCVMVCSQKGLYDPCVEDPNDNLFLCKHVNQSWYPGKLCNQDLDCSFTVENKPCQCLWLREKEFRCQNVSYNQWGESLAEPCRQHQHAGWVDFEDCGSESGEINWIYMPNCPGAPEKCELQHSKEYGMRINFTSKAKVTGIKTKVLGRTENNEVKSIHVESTDGCHSSNLSCPISPGSHQIFTPTFMVETTQSNETLSLQWRLTDQNGKNLLCFKMNAVFFNDKPIDLPVNQI